ncbi:hypothetical protein [Bosea sp. UC22_33]|uniref:hypothetical protein n=1 Tax=Bosea sp. UC22_33 TaxID=3350165 RepID=UPI00366F838B
MNEIEDGEVVVVLRQDVKRGGELLATYQMEYRDLATALSAIRADLIAGRVEVFTVAGRELSDDEITALSLQATNPR